MGNKFGNLLTVFLVMAIVSVIGILTFFGYKVYVADKTNKNSIDKVTEFDKNTGNGNSGSENNSSGSGDGSADLGNVLEGLGDGGNQSSIYQQQGNKDTLYQGYKVIGTISIPSIDIEYPILEENTSDTLKIAIVAVHPKDPANAVNKPGNLVLWGHNYKNGTFFSNIGKLTTGSKIYIKDTSGTKLEYKVYNVYETTDSDARYMVRDTGSAREISLSTCSNQTGKRTIVWARESK